MPSRTKSALQCGHPLTPANLVLESGRWYRCRQCRRNRQAAFRQRRAMQAQIATNRPAELVTRQAERA